MKLCKCYEAMKTLLLFALSLAVVQRANTATVHGFSGRYIGIGGADLTITGSDFAVDQFSYFEPKLGNKVFLDNYARTRSCEVNRYKTNTERIVCRVQKYGLGVRTSWFAVYVFVDGESAHRSGHHWMQYKGLNDPNSKFYYKINNISPKTGAPGTVVTLSGIFNNLYYEDNSEDPLENEGNFHLERLEFGGRTCELLNGNGSFYGFSETEIICKIDSSAVGNFLIELEVETPIGVVVPELQHFRLSSQNQLYNFQSFPLITGVTPAEGSNMGKSLLTITGVGLFNSGSETKVTVGGAECKLLSGSNEKLTCLTPAKSEISQEQYIKGTRGLLYELWDQFVSDLTDNAALTTLFSSSPNVSTVVDKTDVPRELFNGYNDFTARLSGYFTPPGDGQYGFHCYSAALKLYKRVNESYMETLEDIGFVLNGWRSSTGRVTLRTDETYIIEILHHSTTGRTKYDIKIELIDYSTSYTSLDVKRTTTEKQRISIRGTRRKEVQVVNFDALIPSAAPDLSLRFVFAGQKSDPFTVGDIIQEDSAAIETIQTTIWNMVGAECTITTDGSEEVYVEEDFELSPLTMNGKTNMGRNEYVEPYCGHFTGARGGANKVYFGNVDIRRHKWTCFAYMGKYYKFNMQIEFYVTEYGKLVKKKEWVPLEERDWRLNIDSWEYKCYDMLETLKTAKGDDFVESRPTKLHIIAFDCHWTEGINNHIDIFSVSTHERTVQRRPPATHDNVYMRSLTVAKLRNFTFELKMDPINCVGDYQLFGVTLDDNTPLSYTDAQLKQNDVLNYPINGHNVAVERTLRASTNIVGSYGLQIGDKHIQEIPFDLLAREMRNFLERELDLWGLKVHRWGRCYSRDYQIEFPYIPGSQPDITVDDTKLIYDGDGVTSTVAKVSDGHMLEDDMRGSFFRLKTSPFGITVEVNGMQGKCEEGVSCSFNHNTANTPTVTSATSTLNSAAGTASLSITGTLFSTDKTKNVVTVDNVPCTVTSATATTIQCTLTPGRAGTYPVEVRVKPTGLADSSATFTWTASIDSVSPSQGSKGGGTNITVTGQGFPGTMEQWPGGVMSYQSRGCVIQETSYTSFSCVMAPQGKIDAAILSAALNFDSLLSFTFEDSDTPIISSVSPTTTVVEGGGSLTIDGSGFPNVGEYLKVMILDQECIVSSSSITQIVCTLPPNPPGTHDVLVKTATGYANPQSVASVAYTLEVSSISPSTGSLLGGTDLTISGTGFGTDCSLLEVVLGDGEQYGCKIESCTNSQVNCKVQRKPRTVRIENTGEHAYYGEKMVWQPSIADVFPEDVVEWRWTIASPIMKFSIEQTQSPFDDTLQTDGFSSGTATSEGTYSRSFSTMNTVCYVGPERYDLYKPRGCVRITYPDYGSLRVAVNRSMIASDTSATFSVDRAATPTVYSIIVEPEVINPGSSISAIHEGSSLKLKGINLNNAMVKLGNATCDVTDNNDTDVTCTFNSLLGLNALVAYQLRVSTNNLGIAALYLPKQTDSKLAMLPLVDDFNPKTGSETGRFLLTITGSGFIIDGEEPQVSLGSHSCVLESFDHSTITCRGSAGTGNQDLEVKVVTSAGQYKYPMKAELTDQFAYTSGSVPSVGSITPAASNGGLSLTISGSNFGTDSSALTIRLSKSVSFMRRSWLDERMSKREADSSGSSNDTTSESPSQGGGGGQCKSAGSTPHQCSESVSDEKLAEVCPQECPDSGGSSQNQEDCEDRLADGCDDEPPVSNMCVGKCPTEEKRAVLRKRSVIGSSDTYTCTITQINDTNIVCTMDAIAPGNYQFDVVINNFGVGTGTSSLSLTPLIDAVVPNEGSIHGGSTIVITGSGFDPDGVTSVSVGGSPCSVSDVRAGQITCMTSAHAEGTVPLAVTSGSQVSVPVNYIYSTAASPTLVSITPDTGDIGSTFTVSGTVPAGNAMSVTMGGVECVEVVSQSQYQVPELPGGSYDVSVHGDQAGKSNTLQFTIPLAVSSMNPSTSGFAGVIASIDGSAFDTSTPPTVTVCEQECIIVGNNTQDTITCRVPPQNSSLGSTYSCQVSITLDSGLTANLSANFVYDNSLSSSVTGISPKRGGTAGGTTLTITGTGFANSGNTVTIAGSNCVIQSESSTSIVCQTTQHQGIAKEKIEVLVPSKGFSTVDENGEFYYVDRWSSSFSWGGGPLPEEGDFIVIESDVTILLDQSTPILKLLLIKGGTLLFDDEQDDIELNSEYILVTHGGSLQIGTEDQPFENKATVTLHGNVQSIELPSYGAKVLAVREGTLDLHGKYIPVTWTYLSQTAAAGTNTLHLTQGVSWQAGDSIVIATTSHRHSQDETEMKEIASVSADGLTITLTTNLEHEHVSITQTLGGEQVETRGEVGLLTRNVKVQGNVNEEFLYDIEACETEFDTGQFKTQSCFDGRFGAEQGSDTFGATIMMASKERDTRAITGRFSYIEVTHAGQAFRLGRYPIHYHLIGDVSGSYVRGCAIHHTFNRAVTIHTVDNLLVERNVAYNNMGHAVFTEDGIEKNNIIQYNLVVYTRGSSSLLNVDITPSAYWLVHPTNIVRHNAAAGGTHFGFWYRTEAHPTGPSATNSVCQNHEPLGEFFNNTAHSFGWYGLWVFSMDGYFPQTRSFCRDNNPGVATFGKFTAWHCERGAEVVSGGAIRFHDFTALDCEQSGLEFVQVEGPWGDDGPGISNALVVGHSALTTDSSTCMRRGIITPKKKGLSVNGAKLVNFDRDCAALASCSQCKELQGGFPVLLKGLSFTNAPNKVAWKWQHEGWFIDTDGSLSGSAMYKVLPHNELLPSSSCTTDVAAFSFNSEVPGAVCDATIDFHRMDFQVNHPESLSGHRGVFTNQYGSSAVNYRNKRLFRGPGWMVTLLDGENHNMVFENASHITNFSYTGEFFQLRENTSVLISHTFAQRPDTFVTSDGAVKVVGRALDPATDKHGDWTYDNDTKTMTYLVSKHLRSLRKRDADPYEDRELGMHHSITFGVERCLFKGCIIPEPPPDSGKIQAKWSENKAWEGTPEGYGGNNGDGSFSPPAAGTDVIIGKDKYITVDVVLPSLNRVFINGILEIEDARDNVLSATLIVIKGGKLIVGSQNAPFQNDFKIELRGDHSTPDFPLNNGLNVGAKALGVFGELEMHGKDVGMSWTALAQTAAAGSTTIVLEDAVTWTAGAEIIISTSSYESREAEKKIITDVSADGLTLTLDSALQYQHLGGSHTLSDSSSTYKISAKVGILTRNVVIEGQSYAQMIQQSFGARVIIGETYDDVETYTGKARLSNVEFKNAGQEGWSDSFDPRYSLAFWNTGTSSADALSYVKKCSFNHNFNTAIGFFGSNSILVRDNVVYHTVGDSIRDEGTSNRFIHNLVIYTVHGGYYNGRTEDENLAWAAGFQLEKATDVELQNNCVAGSERAGYKYNGEVCGSSAVSSNNEAHGVLHGIHILHAGQPVCSRLSSMFIWKAWDYGIFFHIASSVEISDVTFVDCRVGVLPMIMFPAALSHDYEDKTFTVSDSLFVGRDPSFSCALDVAPWIAQFRIVSRSPTTDSGGQTGLFFGTFVSGESGGPLMNWHGPMSYPAIRGATVISNVKFSNYGDSGCNGQIDIAMTPNPGNDDCTHPITSSGVAFLDTSEEGRLYNYIPNLGKVNPSDCVDMDCDGMKKIVIVDEDGTIIGDNMAGTLISKAEFEWDGDRSRGIGDFRIPLPVKTSLNGENIPVDTFAPNKGIFGHETCTWKESWRMYACHNIHHKMLVIESLDGDTEVRRLSPISILGNRGPNGYIDLVNGPQDHGWCFGYTCQERISTFYTIVATEEEFEIMLTSTPPVEIRFHLLDATSDEAVLLKVWFPKKQQFDVYDGDILVNPTNADFSSGDLKYTRPSPGNPQEFYPDMASLVNGENYYERDTGFVFFLLRGPEPVTIKTIPVVVLSTGLIIDENSFFEDNIIQNLADFLGIDSSQIKITDVVSESSGRIRREAGVVTVEFQIGPAPANPSDSNHTILYADSYDEVVSLAAAMVDGFQNGSMLDAINVTGATSLNVILPEEPPPPPPEPVTEGSVPEPDANQTPLGELQNQQAAEAFENSQTPVVFEIPSSLQLYTDVTGEMYARGYINGPPSVFIANAAGDPMQAGLADSAWIVQVTLSGGAADAELIGQTEIGNVGGWANFTSLRVTKPGNGYTLVFSIKDSNSAAFQTQSTGFNVVAPSFSLHLEGPESAALHLRFNPTVKAVLIDSSTNASMNPSQQGYSWTCTLTATDNTLSSNPQATIAADQNTVSFVAPFAKEERDHITLSVSCVPDPSEPGTVSETYGPIILLPGPRSQTAVHAEILLTFKGPSEGLDASGFRQAVLDQLSSAESPTAWNVLEDYLVITAEGKIVLVLEIIGEPDEINEEYTCLKNNHGATEDIHGPVKLGDEKYKVVSAEFKQWIGTSLPPLSGKKGPCHPTFLDLLDINQIIFRHNS